MSLAFDIVAWLLTLSGLFFVLTGASGLIRLPDLFTRLHAAGMTDTMGAGFLLAGMAVHTVGEMAAGETALWSVLVRLALVYAFLIFTSPIGSHALARAAMDAGERPWSPEGGEEEPAAVRQGGDVAGHLPKRS